MHQMNRACTVSVQVLASCMSQCASFCTLTDRRHRNLMHWCCVYDRPRLLRWLLLNSPLKEMQINAKVKRERKAILQMLL